MTEMSSEVQQQSGGGRALWQAQCTLLVWLSQLLFIPFSLASVDSSLDATAPAAMYAACFSPQRHHRLHARGSALLCRRGPMYGNSGG